jgi:hypothetical protein
MRCSGIVAFLESKFSNPEYHSVIGKPIYRVIEYRYKERYIWNSLSIDKRQIRRCFSPAADI